MEINVDDENKNYSSLDGVLFNKDKTILIQYAKGKTCPDYAIPDGVKIIGKNAFCESVWDYDSVHNVSIPNSVEIISEYAFYGCDMQNINIPSGVTTIEDSAFERCEYMTNLHIPSTVQYIGDDAFSGCKKIISVEIDNGVTSIGESAFSGCSTLSEITIPESVELIGESAFNGCPKLSKVNWNAKQVYDFYSGSGISGNAGISVEGIEVIFGEKVEKIPDNLFEDTDNLASVYIPSSVTSVGQNSLASCNDIEINVDSKNAEYSSLDGVLFNKDKTKIIKFARDEAYPQYNIPDTVTEITDYSFSNCDCLTEITIPENVACIGDKAFYNCSALTQINWNAKSVADLSYGHKIFNKAGNENDGMTVLFGSTVEKIPCYLFYDMPQIAEVNIGENVTDIGASAFCDCTGLTDIIISDSVKNIGEYAFRGCTGLSSITIGENVTNVGHHAFYECTGLTQINWNAINTNDFLYDDYVFGQAGDKSEGITVVFGENVEKIPEYLFYNESANIVSATTIGKNIKNIGDSAFSKTPYYENEDNWTDGVLYMGNYLIATTNNISGSYTIRDQTYAIADRSFCYCDELTNISIPSSVTSIGDSAFYGCNGLANINIPGNVTYIGDWAFSGCIEVSGVNIPNSVTHIGAGAFDDCEKLTNISIPDSVASIGKDLLKGTAYYDNESNWTNDALYVGNHLIKVKPSATGSYSIRASTRTVSDEAFSSCKEITSISIPNSVTYIGNGAFIYCSGLSSINIPDSITAINDETFDGCNNLVNVNIPAGITSIGDSAFYGCSSLKNIEISNNITYIGDCAFYGCSSFSEINIPTGITDISNYAFYKCSSISNISIPENIKNIGDYAFYDCSNISAITIPDSVVSIGASAFYNCNKVKSINIPTFVTSIGKSAFSNLTNLEEIRWNAIDVTDYPTSSNPYSYKANSSGVFLNAGKDNEGVTLICGNAVRKLPNCAFHSTSDKDKNIKLKKAVLNDGIKFVGNYAFAYCDELTELNLPKTVVSLGIGMIYKTCISDIIIPNSVTISESAAPYSNIGTLSGCDLKTVTLENGINKLPFGDSGAYGYAAWYSIFAYADIENIILPESLKLIYNNNYRDRKNAFSHNGNISNITINEKNKDFISIDGVLFRQANNAYNQTLSLVSYPTSRTGNYVLPENAISIRDYAFANSKLTAISIPENIASIGEYAFSGCTNLTNITLPDNITEIDEYTFSGCSSLVSVFIPNNVRLISEGAFDNCSSLKDIYFSGSKSDWENIIIYDDNYESINNAAIHYNATRDGSTPEPDLPEEITINEVRRLRAYDSQTGKLQFNDGDYNAVDDTINYEALVGKFVLIEVKAGELTSIVPVDDGYGNISEISDDNAVIDGETYAIGENIKSYWISPSDIPIHYFTKDNVLVDISYLNTKTGTLEAIDSDKMEITIDGNIYTISSFVDMPVDDLKNHLNREIQYKADSVYDIYGISEADGSELLGIWDMLAQKLNSNIEINSNGKAYARFVLRNSNGNTLKNTTVSYKFVGYDGAYTTTTDDIGMVTVETPTLSGNDETITMEVIFTSSTELKQNTYSFDVKINPLSFSQTWKGKLYGDLGVGAAIGIGGEIETGVNKIEAEAKLGSIGADFKPAKTFSVTNSLNNGTRTLVLDSKLDASVAGNAKVGMYAEAGIGSDENAKKVKLTAADLSGKAEYGESVGYSLKLENYDPTNTEQNLKAARFLFDSAIGINGSNVLLRKALELWDAESYNESGETQTIKLGAGANVASASIGSIGATLVGLSADSIMTSGTSVDSEDKTTHSSGISTSAGVKIGDIKYKETNNNKDLKNVKDASLGTTVFGKNFLNNEATISATANDNVADKISVKSVKANDNKSIFWYKDIESDYSNLIFKDENAKNLADKDENINKLAMGEKSFFTTSQMTDSVENILYSCFDADYSEEKAIERGFDASIGFGLTALLDVNLGIGLSGTKKAGYTYADGMMSQNTIYTTSESDIADEVRNNEKELTEILSEPISALKDKVTGFFESVAGAVKDGVEWGKAKITGAKDWICTITSFNEDSQYISSYSILAVDDEVSLFSTSSVASTIGEPYVVKVTDTNGDEITDFSESPLTLTLAYDNNNLSAAGVGNSETELENLKIYYWDSEKSVYVYIGGELDFANSSVSTEIVKPGQYILAIDNCPPTVTEFSVSDGSGNPSISAVVADMSGISDFEFKIDDTIIVDRDNLYDYYMPSTAVFEYTVNEELSEGEHTASIIASDTSGNSMEEPIVISFTVDNTAPIVQNVVIPELVANGTMNVTAEANDNNLTNVFTCIEYSGQIYRYEMAENNDVWSVEINNLPDFADMKVWVVAYDSAGNSSESSKVSSRTALQPTEDSDIYIGISEINQDSVKVIVNQLSDKTFDGQLILAGFDNNKCQEVKAVDYTSNTGCHDLAIPINEIHNEFRLFYWDNLDGMVPLCTHYTTNSN